MLLSRDQGVTGSLSDDCPSCGGLPPPEFFLPPPPCPFDFEDHSTCTSSLETIVNSGDDEIPIAVIVVTATTFVMLAVVTGLIVCRRRRSGVQSWSKRTPPQALEGAVIYDDLSTAQIMPRTHSTFRPGTAGGRQIVWAPILQTCPGYAGTCGTLSSREPQSMANGAAEPLYQSISSGSGSKNSNYYEDRREDPTQEVRGPPPFSDSEEEDSLTPFLRIGNETPYEGVHEGSKYYLRVQVPSNASTLTSSAHEYESLPVRHGVLYLHHNQVEGCRPPTPQERGLPPLPSRSERFQMFLPSDRRSTKSLGSLYRRTHHGPSREGGLYENSVGLSSRL